MPTAELTLELPADEIQFLKAYAEEHGTTIAALVEAYVRRLKDSGRQPLHPDVLSLTGLVPPELDAKTEHIKRLLEKHR